MRPHQTGAAATIAKTNPALKNLAQVHRNTMTLFSMIAASQQKHSIETALLSQSTLATLDISKNKTIATLIDNPARASANLLKGILTSTLAETAGDLLSAETDEAKHDQQLQQQLEELKQAQAEALKAQKEKQQLQQALAKTKAELAYEKLSLAEITKLAMAKRRAAFASDSDNDSSDSDSSDDEYESKAPTRKKATATTNRTAVAAPTTAASNDESKQAPKKTTSTSSKQKNDRSALLAGISSFNRKKLKTAKKKRTPKHKRPQGGGMAALLAGVKGFNKNKLKKTSETKHDNQAAASSKKGGLDLKAITARAAQIQSSGLSIEERMKIRRKQQQEERKANSNPFGAKLKHRRKHRKSKHAAPAPSHEAETKVEPALTQMSRFTLMPDASTIAKPQVEQHCVIDPNIELNQPSATSKP